MKLTEVSKGVAAKSAQELRNFAIAEIVSQFPIAAFAEFYSMTGNADSIRKTDATMTAGTNRSIGSDYTPKTNTPAFATVELKVYGDKIATDKAYERRGIDIGSQRMIDLVNGSRAIGRKLMDAFINDEKSTTAFSGIKEQIAALGRKFVFDTENGGTLPLGNTDATKKQQDKFIEYLDGQINSISGGPDCIILNGQLIARFNSLSRGLVTYSSVKDVYGADQIVQYYRGIPLVNAGYKSNGTGLVIPNDETEGTSIDKCTSLYLVKFGMATDVAFATNVGFDVTDHGVVGMNYVTSVEADLDLVVANASSVAQISGIMLS